MNIKEIRSAGYRDVNGDPLSKEDLAAIKGYWRSGAAHEQISWVTGVEYHVVEKIVLEYSESEKEAIII